MLINRLKENEMNDAKLFKETGKKRDRLAFLCGLAITTALALAVSALLAGCAKKFDGTSLVGTTWVGENTEDLSSYGAGKYTAQGTLKFTSDSAVTQELKVTKWEDNWSDEMKSKLQGMMDEENGEFPYTYDAADHTGSADGNDFTKEALIYAIEHKSVLL
ncbi:MAG: hypothetical protein MdMp014T_2553 [Treponematales bacterium]